MYVLFPRVSAKESGSTGNRTQTPGSVARPQRQLLTQELFQIYTSKTQIKSTTLHQTNITYLRVLIITDIATEGTPALGVDLQGRDNFRVIPCRKVSHKLHSIGLTLVRKQVSEVCSYRYGCLTQLHQSIHVRLKQEGHCSRAKSLAN
jgi:hypothetical protein